MRSFLLAATNNAARAKGPRRWRAGAALAAVPAAALVVFLATSSATNRPIVIGPVATVTEASTGAELTARVDTGAAVSSLHCSPEDCVIHEPADDPRHNIGKPIRLRVETRDGQKAWIKTQITDYVEVRNAEAAEHRYQVRLPLRYGSFSKETIVNLNDRSQMTYRMLLGRDFLAGHFVVDVARDPGELAGWTPTAPGSGL